jgi:histidinol dehydrogenase
MNILRILPANVIGREFKAAVSDSVLEQARVIVDRVRDSGESAIREYASRFDERNADEPLVVGRDAMRAAFDSLSSEDQGVLIRTAQRIEVFACAQHDAIQPMTVKISGGETGHTIEPVGSAGCYAPAGRYPLPSSVLMTAITARVAGCKRVVVASPGEDRFMLAAAHVAGADEYLCVGGAHAIAAMAYGIDGFDRCDVIVGPGNAWVTAAKQLVSGVVGIDMLAGPSELMIIADESASVEILATDLLAQAEHDIDAVPMLLTTHPDTLDAIQYELERQLASLQTAQTAREALKNGFVVLCENVDQAIGIANRIAPEHLQISTRNAQHIADRVQNAGAVFIGEQSPEVMGDYGVGPNHTLPTGGTARFQAGLSVMHFLRLRTWIRIDEPAAFGPVASDMQRLAEMEGLWGHKNAVVARGERAS